MIGQMPGHRRDIVGNQDSISLFRPENYSRIGRSQWQIFQVADASTIQRQLTVRIVSLDGASEGAAKVLVKDESKRHGLLLCLGPAYSLHPPSKLIPLGPTRSVSNLLLQ